MEPDLLMERLQRAVGPDYRVVRKLGAGGMGTVYLAHEVPLNRDVAIKVLRVELATAEGADSFHREMRVLAGIRHPNVVVIYRPGEGEGLHFYIMELLNGPTLEDRLEAGPLPVTDTMRLGIDVLRGLEQVHRVGLVHRDIKPSNIFLLPDRGVLSDFGIASVAARESGGEGTPDYMAPEQVEGKPLTPRIDIYSLGVVLYEAVTGRRFHEQGQKIDWSGIPAGLARALRRAVTLEPEGRWPDAATFRHALQRPRLPIRPILKRAAVIAGAVLLIGAVKRVFIDKHPPAAAASGTPTVAFDRIDYAGPSERRALADSLIHLVKSELHDHVEFRAEAVASIVVKARMTVSGNDVGVRMSGGISAPDIHLPVDSLSALRDSLSYRIALGVWDRSPLASLPQHALPRTTNGLVRFLEAEQLIAEERWQDAHSAFLAADRTDPTCWICSWRITEIDRWLGHEPDRDRLRRVQVHADSLPQPYRSLIRAPQLPERQRLDTLRAAAENAREIFLGWFQLGDELFHRGALAGHRRAEAIPPLERAARLRPDFGPTWEHLAWVATAEGDSADAIEARDSLARHGTRPDTFSVGLRALLDIGFAWRFLPDSAAERITREGLGNPTTQANPDLAAGPRLLPTFDAPRGAIALGALLEGSSSIDLRRSGLIAQALGAVALGRLDSARTAAGRLAQIAPDAELTFFFAELQAALAVIDSASVPREAGRDALRLWLLSDAAALHERAAWMSSLLEGRSRLRRSASPDIARLVVADSLAAAGLPRGALKRLEAVDVDSIARAGDPFYRTVFHFRRAEWRAAIGDVEGARAELLWFEHLDLVGLPTGLPQAAEVDWAVGALARWRLARLLDGHKQGAEACAPYAAVARLWSNAPPPFGARADTARTRARELGCR